MDFIVGIKLIIGAITHVAAQQPFAKPFPPEQPQLGDDVILESADWQGDHQAEAIDRNNAPEAWGVIGHLGIVNVAGNKTNTHIDAINYQQQQRNYPQ